MWPGHAKGFRRHTLAEHVDDHPQIIRDMLDRNASPGQQVCGPGGVIGKDPRVANLNRPGQKLEMEQGVFEATLRPDPAVPRRKFRPATEMLRGNSVGQRRRPYPQHVRGPLVRGDRRHHLGVQEHTRSNRRIDVPPGTSLRPLGMPWCDSR